MTVIRTSKTLYPCWHECDLCLPLSTTLYNLSPVFDDLWRFESLTSYVSRIALAHHVSTGTLINKLIAKVLKNCTSPKRIKLLNGSLREFSCSINGIGQMALKWSDSVRRLTGMDTIRLTLLRWKNLVSNRALLKQEKQWCNSCLRLMEKRGVIYEPLLWTLKQVTHCSIHHTPMQQQCFHCKARQFWIDSFSRPGFCSNCKTFLADGSQRHATASSRKQPLSRRSKAAIDLFFGIQETPAQSINSANIFRNLVNQTFDGNAASAAKRLKKGKSSIHYWREGKIKPKLDDLIKSILHLNIDPKELLKNYNASSQFPRSIRPSKPDRKPPRFRKLSGKVKAYTHRKRAVSVSEMAKRLKINKRILYRHFNHECKQISARYRKQKETALRIERKRLCEKIEQAVIQMSKNEKNLSRRKVAKMLHCPKGFQHAEVQDVLRRIRTRKMATTA